MILLLGGTSETSALALAMAEAGHDVLVSTCTDVWLAPAQHPRIRRRCGALDAQALGALVREQGLTVIVDATHPYAVTAHGVARDVAVNLGITHVRFQRESGLRGDEEVLHAATHEQAARLAFAERGPVLLTTGSRHLEPYARAARSSGRLLIARVLDHPDSLAACRRAGLADGTIVTGRGPFSVEQNRELIRRFAISVLVTKDGGAEGGLAAKLQAAAGEGCRVVVVDRPALVAADEVHTVTELVARLGTAAPRESSRARH